MGTKGKNVKKPKQPKEQPLSLEEKSQKTEPKKR